MLWLVVLQVAGLYWGTQCTVIGQPASEPPLVVEFMFIPSAFYLGEIGKYEIPDSVVDRLLDKAIRAGAEANGFMCRPVRRVYDQARVEDSRRWPVQEYKPEVGWFRYRVRTPVSPMRRSSDPPKRDPGSNMGQISAHG